MECATQMSVSPLRNAGVSTHEAKRAISSIASVGSRRRAGIAMHCRTILPSSAARRASLGVHSTGGGIDEKRTVLWIIAGMDRRLF